MAAINILFEVSPILPDGNVTTLRMSADKASSAGVYLDGYEWLPIITERPTYDIKLTSNGLLDQIQISYGSISFNLSNTFANEVWSTYDWTGALGRIWVGEEGAAFTEYEQIFEGSVSALSRDDYTASCTLLGTEADLNVNLLYDAYEGIGGAEGPPSLKGKLKPWASGICINVDPVLVDSAYWIYQVHGYGPIQDIPAVYEFAQKLADPVASVNTFAELAALTLVPGQWAKCLPLGMFRLGGQPSQKMTCDVHGAKDGSTFPTSVSGIVEHLIKVVSPAATFGNLSIFDDVDWCYYATSQAVLGDVARQAAYEAGGYLFPDGSGTWQLGNFFNPKTPVVLSTERDAEPLVLSITEDTSGGPIHLVRIGYDRCWSIHTDAEISPALLELAENADAIAQDAADAKEAAEQAAADTIIAVQRLNAMSADGVLDRAEKKYWTGEYAKLLSEKNQLIAEATAFSDVADEKTALENAFSALDAYLATLSPSWNNPDEDTPVVRADFVYAWRDVYVARQTLQSAMATAASQTALWDLINDPNGTKPEDNATVGAPPGTVIGDRPVESVLSDIDYLLENGGVAPPSVLAPILQDRIEQIEANTIIGVAANDEFSRIVETRATERIEVESQARLDLETIMNEKFDLEEVARQELQVQIDGNEAAFLAEQAARISDVTALSSNIVQLTTNLDDTVATLSAEQIARSTADDALAADVTTLTASINDSRALILEEQYARATADIALSTSITELTADLDDTNVRITDEQTARADGDEALATSLSNLNASLGVTNANITAEQVARANADAALTSQYNALNASLGTTNANVTAEQQARANADSALAGRATALESTVNNGGYGNAALQARIAAEESARANAVAAEASTRNTLAATLRREDQANASDTFPSNFREDGKYWISGFVGNPATAPILAASSTYSFPDIAGVGKVCQVVGPGSGTYVDFSQLGVIRATSGRKYRITLSYRVSSVGTGGAVHLYAIGLNSAYNYIAGATASVAHTPTAASTTYTVTIERTGDQILSGGGTYVRAMVRSFGTTVYQHVSVVTEDITAAQSVNDAVSAQIANEAGVRASADSALTTQYNALNSRMGAAEAGITNEANTRATADTANANSINAVTARLNNSASTGQTVEARVAGAYTAVANESSARSSAINQVTTNFNGQISGVQTNISTINNTINGIQNKWSVTLDANGKMAGIALINGSNSQAEFGVRADRFVFYNASGQGTAPFYISGNQTYINNAIIPNASIGGAKIADLTVGGEKVTANAITGVGVYDGYLSGYHYTSGSYRDLPNTSVWVSSGQYDVQKAIIWFSFMASRDGGDDDNIAIRLYRNDGAILGDFIDCQMHGGRRLYSCTFVDQNVAPNTSYNYRIQYYSIKDGSPYWYDVTLIAMIMKK